MPKGKFEFDADASPTFNMQDLQAFKRRAMRESGVTRQFYSLSNAVFSLIPGYKVDAVLLLGLALVEFALHVMRRRSDEKNENQD